MVKLGLRRLSTRSNRSSRGSTSRRSSEDSAMAGGSVHSRHSDYSDGSFPSVTKSVASGRSGRSSLRSSIVSMMSLDTVKASNGGSKRDLFKSTGKMSSFRKSFKNKKSSGRRSSGEEKISLQLEQGEGGQSQFHVRGGGGARGRRTSATPTVLTMGTAASAALAAADAAGDGPVSVALLKPGSGRRASATRAGGVRRTTLGSIPDGIDFIEDPDAGDDHTVGDKSNCSDLSGLTGLASSLEPNQAGDDNNSHSPGASGAPHQPHHRRGGTRRGSVEISRPAAQGRRRSSLCRIPDGITLVHMSAALAELDMSGETALDDSLGNMGASASGGLNLSSSNGLNLEGSSSSGTDLAGSKTKMTIEEEASNPIKEEEEESQEESDQEDSPTEEVKKSSAVVSALLCMDHRLKAEKVAQRRALFRDPPPHEEQDPRLAPPAFPALAEFVATLSKNADNGAPPVNVISFPSGEPSRSSSEPRPSPREEEEEEMVRARPLQTSGSALDRLLQNLSSEKSSSSPAEPAAAAAPPSAPEAPSSSLSAALDRIQASRPKSSGGPSALDRLLEERKKPSAKGEGGGMSALDRLLVQPASQPSALSFLNNHARPRGQAPPSPPPESARPQAPPSTPASATFASSAIDRILQSRASTTKAAAAAARSSSCGGKALGLTAVRHHPIGGGIPGGAFGNSAPRTLSSSQSERRGAPAPKKARSA